MTGYNKAKETVDKLKEESRQESTMQVDVSKEERNHIVTINNTPDLLRMYAENAQVGASNLAGELPLLKVHSAGRSTKNVLADGNRPDDGAFFYKPTAEQFKTVTCHILTISKGFRAEGLEGKEEKKAEVFNQIMGGVIIDGEDYKPFIMYFTGLKLSHLWNFGKEAAKYTKAKPFPIPMFALRVTLSTSRQTNSFGESWIINFEIEKDENGSPLLVTDTGRFQFLKDNVDMIEETISSLIEAKTVREAEVEEAIPGEVLQTEDTPF